MQISNLLDYLSSSEETLAAPDAELRNPFDGQVPFELEVLGGFHIRHLLDPWPCCHFLLILSFNLETVINYSSFSLILNLERFYYSVSSFFFSSSFFSDLGFLLCNNFCHLLCFCFLLLHVYFSYFL